MKAALDLCARYFIMLSAANYILTSTHMFQVPVSSRSALQLQCGAMYEAALDLSARYFILSSAANYILTSTHMFQVPVSSRLALQLQCGAVYESCP